MQLNSLMQRLDHPDLDRPERGSIHKPSNGSEKVHTGLVGVESRLIIDATGQPLDASIFVAISNVDISSGPAICHVLFDLDGTLLDSIPLIVESMRTSSFWLRAR